MATRPRPTAADRHAAASILRRLPRLLVEMPPAVAAYLRGRADALDSGKGREAPPRGDG